PQRMHNYYTHLYNRTVFELLERRRGAGEAVLFARSATAGGQQYPVHWGGDCDSTYASMVETLRGGLPLAASGFGYWSHDIGGFEGTPDAGVFKRWLAFGLLSSHSRLHGSDSHRVPWAFDDEAVEVARKFTRLKMTLMPYLLGAARQATEHGTPILRPMVLEFPDDPATEYLSAQYMLGDSLLVAPVFHADGHVRYYVPKGRWTALLDGRTVVGPRWVQETHGFDSLPLLVRPGSVLPIGTRDDGPEYDYADGLALHLFDPESLTDTAVSVPDGNGQTVQFGIRRVGREVTVHGPDPAEHPWSIVRRADEKTDGSASTTTATSASVSLTLPDTSSTVSGPPADPPSPLPPRRISR
ncbi:MAG TPA: TIM-barrel domain-containing protein, partial [Nakamurella sp.]